METENNIFKYWPMKGFQLRDSQKKVLEWIENLPPDIKYIFCEIPVGGGKSPIGLNYSSYLANSFGDSFILTPQKILQTQYQNSFDSKMLFSLYGKANYPCESKKTNCDIGSSLKPACKNCPHKAAMIKARGYPNTVLNYHLALLLFGLANELSLKKRKLVVFDECHTLEHFLTEFNSLQIGAKRCKSFNVKWSCPFNEDEAIEWIRNEYLPAVETEKKKMGDIVADIEQRYEFSSEPMDKMDADIINKYKDIKDHWEKIINFTLKSDSEIKKEYVLIKDKNFFKFKEIYGKNVFKKLVIPRADRFLFMSATIIDKKSFCKDIGIPEEETAFISIDSEFDKENRPVFYLPSAKMTYGWNKPERKNDRQKMLERVIEICSLHKDDAGVIHTGSFQIAKWLIDELDGKIPQRIFHHTPSDDDNMNPNRDNVISEFVESSEPRVLISPSITEGLDLKNDLGRFSITCKVPYPYLGDAWVKKRQELSQDWYRRQALISIIQATGRVVRSKTDWGYSYILDESFYGLYNSMKNKIPPWFKESLNMKV